jgi:acetoin utilization deacetylase AcuC-like enzyme
MRSNGSFSCSLHPEAMSLPAHSIDTPARLERAMAVLGARNAKLLYVREPASDHALAAVHDPSYIEGLDALAVSGWEGRLDPELRFGAQRMRGARYAAGAMIAAVRGALARPGGTRRGAPHYHFCLSRPGSHHAGWSEALGHCLVNNLAVAARIAIDEFGLQRVAIVDFDAHHGNGTAEIFYSDPRVLACSVHQYPFFPGTGRREESGAAEGEGATLNLPLEAGSGHEQGIEAMRYISERVAAFGAELILYEAGFDGHADDWTSDLRFGDRTFERFGRMSAQLASGLGVPCLFELGGGYVERSIAGGFAAFLRGLEEGAGR